MGHGRHSSGRHARRGIPSRGLFLSVSFIPARVRRLVRRVSRIGLVSGLTAVIIAGAGLALASHGDDYIDLASSAGLAETHDGAMFIQGGTGAGTGTFDPFLTANSSGNATTQAAINVCVDDKQACPDPQFDTFTGGGRTHHLNLAAVPELDIGGVLYREFSLDANDQGGEDFMSIDLIRIFLDNEKTAGGYDPSDDSFDENSGPAPFLAWALDIPILLRSQTFTPGSGVSDITVLVPTDEFVTPEDCSYGSQECIHFLYFYYEAGGTDVVLPGFEEVDWSVTAGFEEWRTRLLPTVEVDKTANPSFDREFDWEVTKEVSLGDTGPWSDSETVNLFDGQADTVYWQINVTKSTPIDSGYAVSGTITIANPTGGSIIEEEVDAEIQSVVDVIDGVGPVAVDCGVTFPLVLESQETLVCTYSSTLPNSDTRTNTVTVTIEDDDDGTAEYSATAPVDFSGVSPTVTDDTADLTDALLSIDEVVNTSGSRVVPMDVDCDDEGTITNTAVVTESDSGDSDTDSAAVTISCYQLTVSKDATPSFDREFDWEVTKEVSLGDTGPWSDSETVNLFDGQADTVYWQINVTKSTPIDSGYAVSGTITIQNPAPIAAENVAVTDVLTGGIAATVDCDPVTAGEQTTVTIAAASSAQCSYSATLPDASTRTNTATATLAGEDYTGTASVDFTGVTPNQTDETIDVTDTYAGVLGQVTATPPDPFTHTFTYQRTVTGSSLVCGDNLIENTATFVTTDTAATDSADEDVTITVECPTGEGCTPGFWQGGVGFFLWDTANDPDFSPPGGNGDFWHDVEFNDYFTSVASLDGLTLLDLVSSGGGSDPAQRAARSLVAAYLNALSDGVSYEYTTEQLEDMWDAAVSAGDFDSLHNDLDEKNNLGADLCGFSEDPLEASAIGLASIAIAISLLISAAWGGRHVRRFRIIEA